MGGLLTCRQCSKRMESLKDHSFWDICRTCVRKYFWFILVTVIVLTLSIIHYSRAPPDLVGKCPKDQPKLLHNISQVEPEKVILKEQLIKMEKKMQKLKNIMNQTQEKSLQLLEKKKEEADALSKELSGFNQSLVLTRQLLEKEREKAQSLQNQLEKEKEDLRKIQQQRDSCQKRLNTLEEELKSPGSKTREYEGKIAELERQIKQEKQRNQDNFRHEREQYQNRITELHDQIRSQQQEKSSTKNILEDGTIMPWALVIFLLFICCVKCCRQEQ
ncbi:calponin homology domain-containing protein DDB_G0272472-like [Pantherophis guttatus]|uniref:Calponin homology domain-containing protein DDB_G0272472-like n=1 Tax=Pantherophis guttatus TaxID=94885 RepID=A0A6P9DMN1_PANGU|nr:calponin homology domain-containing protein DDB_G0272472-like [Pantherophis guttatus]